MTTIQESPSWRDRRRRLVLQLATMLALGWVSYGSHEVLIWIGLGWWVAWIYPGIVDLAVLYVTPFAADATLPKDGEWPIRSHATHTRVLIWWSVAAFNVLHMVLLVQKAPINGLYLRIVAYSVGVIAGVAPVIFYGRAFHLETLDAAWHIYRRRQTVVDAQQADVAERERQRRAAEQRERDERERAEKDKREQRDADERERDRQADLERTRIKAAVPGKAKVKAAIPAATPAGNEDDGPTLSERIRAVWLREWEAGNNPNGSQVYVAAGGDPNADKSLGRTVRQQLERAGYGPRPVSEQEPAGLRLASSGS